MTKLRAPFVRPFPGRVERFFDEPSYGLLLRTACHNGVRTVYTAFQRSGLKRGQGVSDLDPARVALLCGHDARTSDVDALAAASPKVDASCVRVFGESLKRDQFSVMNRRWCPECLAESPHHRVWWDIPYVTACPRHGCAIVDRCGCASAPKWKTSFPTKCRHGHDFTTVTTAKAPEHELALSAYIVDRFLGRAPASAFDDLPSLGDALVLMDHIGRVSFGEGEGLATLRARVGRGAMAAEGFRILSDLPTGFDGLLDRLMADRGEKVRLRKWGVEAAYGNFYTWLTQYPLRGSLPDRLRSLLAEHAQRHLTIKTGAKVAGLDVPKPAGVDLTEAAARCGMTFEYFRRVATLLGVVPKASIRGKPARLSESVVVELAAKLRGRRTREQAAEELGIAPHVAGALIVAGTLKAIVDGKSDRDTRTNVWLLPEHAVSDLLEDLQRKVAAPGAKDRDDLAPINLAARIARVPLPTVIRLALCGDLAVSEIDREAVGLAGILVSKSDVVLAARRDRVPGFTLTEAAAEMGVSPQAMKGLRDANIIACVDVGHIQSVSVEEVGRFRKKYVTTPEVATLLGTSCLATLARLEAAGVKPECDRPRFHQVLYLRQEVEAAVGQGRLSSRRKEAKTLPPEDGIDSMRAAALMGIQQTLLTELVRSGKVPSTPVPRGYVVRKCDVEIFVAEFVTATGLAPLLGKRGAVAVHPILEAAGVPATFGPPEFGGHVFPRAAATAAVNEAVRARAAAAAADAGRRETVAEATVSARDAAKRLGMTDLMLTQVRNAKRIEATKVGREWLYSEAELKRFEGRYVVGARLGDLCPDRDDLVGDGGGLTKLLIGQGLKPVCERPSFYSYLFGREEASQAIQRHVARVDAEAKVPRARERSQDALTLREACAQIGLGAPKGTVLVREGLLTVEMRPGMTLVRKAEVARFRSEYVLLAEVARDLSGKYGGRDGAVGVVAALRLLQALKVKPALDFESVDFYVFHRNQVDDAVARWRDDPSVAVPVKRDAGWLSAADIGERLGTGCVMVKRLLDEGLIAGRTSKRSPVAERHVAEFQRKYVLANDYNESLGAGHAGGVTRKLALHGVHPVVVIPPLPAKLYLRSEVEKVLGHSGRSSPSSPDAAKVEMCEAEAATLRDADIVHGKVSHMGDLSAADVASRLKVTRLLVTQVIDGKLLGTQPGRPIRVSEADLCKFRKRYALANEYGASLDLNHAAAVTMRLAKLGVFPSRFPFPLTTAIYEREEVELALGRLLAAQGTAEAYARSLPTIACADTDVVMAPGPLPSGTATA